MPRTRIAHFLPGSRTHHVKVVQLDNPGPAAHRALLGADIVGGHGFGLQSGQSP